MQAMFDNISKKYLNKVVNYTNILNQDRLQFQFQYK
jgi:hypothetical protein